MGKYELTITCWETELVRLREGVRMADANDLGSMSLGQRLRAAASQVLPKPIQVGDQVKNLNGDWYSGSPSWVVLALDGDWAWIHNTVSGAHVSRKLEELERTAL